MIPIKGYRQLQIRSDSAGDGHYAALRGRGRTHRGVDFLLPKGEALLSPVQGIITKIGYPYGDDLKYKYVEITVNGFKHRFFYVENDNDVGTNVLVGTCLGAAQDIVARYPSKGMTNHIHYEIKYQGTYIDPEEYWS